MKVRIDYSDGTFTLEAAPEGGGDTVTIDERVWRAYLAWREQGSLIQAYLLELDTRHSACAKGWHARDNQDCCHYCGKGLD